MELATLFPPCPLCGEPAPRYTVRYYERMEVDPDTQRTLDEPIRAIVEEERCGACQGWLERAWEFDEELLVAVEELAAILEYNQDVPRQEAEARAVAQICGGI